MSSDDPGDITANDGEIGREDFAGFRVAIVHDWFTLKGGAEQCVEQFLLMFPQADVFCLVDFLPESDRAFLAGHKITTSFLQRMPGAAKHYRSYLPLMPIAVEQFDMSDYDIVISTSSAVSKGVLTGPNQLHISYIFSPIRYAWDLQHIYLRESKLVRGLKSAFVRTVLHYVRIWDTRTAHGVDSFVAISSFIARRIQKAYGRSSTVIYPPVDIDRFTLSLAHEDFYVTASRLVPYKCVPLIAQAFALMPERKLVIVGDGPDMDIVKKAAGPNVTVLGRQTHDELLDLLRRAKAFIFAAEEDFGIAPLEAQACGTPVVAYGRGGALETIRGELGDDQTGVFFYEQSPQAIVAAVRHLDERLPFIRPAACRANALRFSPDRFRREFRQLLSEALVQFDIKGLKHRPLSDHRAAIADGSGRATST